MILLLLSIFLLNEKCLGDEAAHRDKMCSLPLACFQMKNKKFIPSPVGLMTNRTFIRILEFT